MSRSVDDEDRYMDKKQDERLGYQPLCVTVTVTEPDIERLVVLAARLGHKSEPNEDPRVAARFAASYLLRVKLLEMEGVGTGIGTAFVVSGHTEP